VVLLAPRSEPFCGKPTPVSPLLAVNTMRPFGRPEAIDQPPKSSLKNPAISAIMGQLPTG
jgi:hypothetical protein